MDLVNNTWSDRSKTVDMVTKMKKKEIKVPKKVIEELKRLKKVKKHKCRFTCGVCKNTYPVELNRKILFKWHEEQLSIQRKELIEEVKKNLPEEQPIIGNSNDAKWMKFNLAIELTKKMLNKLK